MKLSELNLDWTTHGGPFYYRQHGVTQIGEWTVSVVVGEEFYCEPRQDNLPIDDYWKVEVAVLRPGEDGAFYWTMQETPVGEYFSEGDRLAPYVSIEALSQIMQYLRNLT